MVSVFLDMEIRIHVQKLLCREMGLMRSPEVHAQRKRSLISTGRDLFQLLARQIRKEKALMRLLRRRCHADRVLPAPVCLTLIVRSHFHAVPVASVADAFHIEAFFNAVHCLGQIVLCQILPVLLCLVGIAVIRVGESFTAVFPRSSGTRMPFAGIIILIAVLRQCVQIDLMDIIRIRVIVILSVRMRI